MQYSILGFNPTVENGITIENILLVEGNEQKSYEPYTGGIPAPNPEFPISVETLKGYNLLDETTLILGKGIDGSGNITSADTLAYYEQFIKVNPSKEYTFSSNVNIAYLRVCEYDKDKKFIQRIQYTAGNLKTFEVSQNCEYIRLTFYQAPLDNAKQMIYLGATEKPYLPYNSIGVKRIGKNKFDKNYFTRTSYNASGGIVANGYTLVDNEVTCKRSNTDYGRTFMNKVTLPKGNYTISYEPYLSGTDLRARESLRDFNAGTDIIASRNVDVVNGTRHSMDFSLENETTIYFSITPSYTASGTLTLKMYI